MRLQRNKSISIIEFGKLANNSNLSSAFLLPQKRWTGCFNEEEPRFHTLEDVLKTKSLSKMSDKMFAHTNYTFKGN